MNRRDFGKGIALASVGLASGGCEMIGLEWRYRFRLLAEVIRLMRFTLEVPIICGAIDIDAAAVALRL